MTTRIQTQTTYPVGSFALFLCHNSAGLFPLAIFSVSLADFHGRFATAEFSKPSCPVKGVISTHFIRTGIHFVRPVQQASFSAAGINRNRLEAAGRLVQFQDNDGVRGVLTGDGNRDFHALFALRECGRSASQQRGAKDFGRKRRDSRDTTAMKPV